MSDSSVPQRQPSSDAASPPDADARDRAATYLAARFADDTISLDEFERRVSLVYAARSASELAAVTADISAPAPGVHAAAAIPVAVAPRIRVLLGNLERRGAMELPRRLELRVRLGNAELDFSDATLPGGTIEIHIEALLGNAELTLPAGVRVENHGIGILGSWDCHAPKIASASPTTVRITGRAVLSSVSIHFAGTPVPDVAKW